MYALNIFGYISLGFSRFGYNLREYKTQSLLPEALEVSSMRIVSGQWQYSSADSRI